MTMQSPSEIQGAYTLRGVNVSRYGEGVRRQATGLVESMASSVYRYILLADLSTRRKKEKAIKRITRIAVAHYEEAGRVITEAMVDLARDESSFFKSIFGRGSGKQILKREAEAIIKDLLIDGVTLEEWLVGQAMSTAQRIAREVRISPADATKEQISERIFGRNTGRFTLAMGVSGRATRVPVFQGSGLLETARRYLNTVSKSAILAAQQTAGLEAFKRSRLVTKLELSVILDRRTSDICNSRAGAVWYADTGQPTEESATSEPFPGPPPYHLNCRSILLPFSDELPDKITLKEWISSLTKAKQKEILGSVRYNSWKEGKLNLDIMDEIASRPMSIDDLRGSY